jgi:hypothetical protein
MDTLECRGAHRVECFWHFSESCEISVNNSALAVANDGRRIRMILSDPKLRFDLVRGQVEPPCGWISRSFDVKVPTAAARVAFDISGTTLVTTEIVCE